MEFTMIQTSIINKSELYYIFSEGLKKPSRDWVSWYNNGGRDTVITLLQAVDKLFGEEISHRLPKSVDYNELFRLHMDSFQIPSETRVVAAESIYNKWTNKRGDSTSFTPEGYLMGDSAIHMRYIYRELGIEIPNPNEFHLSPDHLIFQLQLLAVLEEKGYQNYIYEYILDHLDWTDYLVSDCEKKEWSGFYYEWLLMIHLFLKNRYWEC